MENVSLQASAAASRCPRLQVLPYRPLPPIVFASCLESAGDVLTTSVASVSWTKDLLPEWSRDPRSVFKAKRCAD